MSMKNSNDTVWDRTNDLPICSKPLNHCATAVPSASVVKCIIKTFLLIAGQLKVYEVPVFSNKCWSFLLIIRDIVVAIVAGLEAETLRNRISIFDRASDFFFSPNHED